uniref:Uncharacterized protein n=1 Tax=Haptolina brevifila TaxID=156173 RepID=A0A7S2I6X3_9EUKA|mmetsp:Transcript_62274/g.123086  ORF Transcript_62274/g.123086 Transcript_62274/m.123086 type:complete len:160 (+) Transcript_62274:136-615(+)
MNWWNHVQCEKWLHQRIWIHLTGWRINELKPVLFGQIALTMRRVRIVISSALLWLSADSSASYSRKILHRSEHLTLSPPSGESMEGSCAVSPEVHEQEAEEGARAIPGSPITASSLESLAASRQLAIHADANANLEHYGKRWWWLVVFSTPYTQRHSHT